MTSYEGDETAQSQWDSGYVFLCFSVFSLFFTNQVQEQQQYVTAPQSSFSYQLQAPTMHNWTVGNIPISFGTCLLT